MTSYNEVNADLTTIASRHDQLGSYQIGFQEGDIILVTLNGLRNLTIFVVFSKFQTIQKTKTTIIISFAQGFPLFWALGLHRCT